MSRFWRVFCAILCVSFAAPIALTITTSAQAQGVVGDPTASSTKPAEKVDTIRDCSEVADCNEERRKRTRKSSRWVECTIPPYHKIENDDGTYTAVKTESRPILRDGKCICPEGFELSKAFRKVGSKPQDDGTILENWEVSGRCLPPVEPNAEIVAQGLNSLTDWLAKVDKDVGGNYEIIGGLQTTVGGHTKKINYNRQQINQLRRDVQNLKRMYEGACKAPNLSAEWRKMCKAIADADARSKNRMQLYIGGSGELNRFPDRTQGGVAFNLGWMSPRHSNDVPVRFEAGTRIGWGQAGNINADRDDGAAFLITGYGGPVVDLTQDTKYQLHLRGMGQTLLDPHRFEAMGRRYGAEVAVSICPWATEANQSSLCFRPFVNGTHGRSRFDREPTEEVSNPPMRGESGWTAGGGASVVGRW